MRKVLVTCISFVVLVIAFFLYQQYQQNIAYMTALELHQPIVLEQVSEVRAWKSTEDPKSIPIDKVESIINGFNSAEPEIIKGDFYNLPTSEAGMVIALKSGHEVSIYYVEGLIDVVRKDINPETEVTYILRNAPVLEDYFEAYLDEK